MIERLAKFLGFRKREKNNRKGMVLSGDISENLKHIRSIFGESSDLIIRKFNVGAKGLLKCAIIHIDGMVDKDLLGNNILKALMLDMGRTSLEVHRKNAFDRIRDSIMSLSEVKDTHQMSDVVTSILSGDSVFLLDKEARALIIGTKYWNSRAIEEPMAETSVRGPREGFTEVLRTNITLIRRRIKSPRLQVETFKIGELTQTDVAIMYLRDLATDELVEEVRSRLKRIRIDAVLESGYIEELIEDSPISPFSTTAHTERPDNVAAQILEGKVAILCDNTPFVLTVPAIFQEFLQASEDYYERFHLSTFIRWIRYLSMFISLALPATWVAVTTYHQELIPTPMLLSIAAAREGVPLPTVGEVLLMEVAFEILREAGVRLPRPVGGAISIVGGLVIGDAAVRAGLVSAPVVIVVAFTGIASYAISGYSLATTLRLLRFPLIIVTSVLGLYGLIVSFLLLYVHLASLRSFGVPYLSPTSPFILKDMKDTLIRAPWWAMFTRPHLSGIKEPIRETPDLKPSPPRGKESTGRR
jgi:spore germination protein KA